MKQAIKMIFAIIAALIGAGFASGQEISIFFYSYGIKGIAGIIVCSIIISYVIYKVLNITYKNDVNTYQEFVYILIRKKGTKEYFNIGFIINQIINLFLLMSFFIMIAGFGAYFSQELSINSYIGSAILSILCYITLIKKNDIVVKINSFLIPIIIVFIVVIGIKNITTINVLEEINKLKAIEQKGWLISSILYSSYNSIFLIPLIITLKKYIRQKRDILIVAVTSGVIIFILAIAIFMLLTRINININQLEMPAIYVISNYFAKFKIIYAFIILASIYTTAISIGIGLLENITNNKKSNKMYLSAICLFGFLISGIGFSNLVSYVYPVFGYIGLIQIAKIFFKRL